MIIAMFQNLSSSDEMIFVGLDESAIAAGFSLHYTLFPIQRGEIHLYGRPLRGRKIVAGGVSPRWSIPITQSPEGAKESIAIEKSLLIHNSMFVQELLQFLAKTQLLMMFPLIPNVIHY